jgi:hypothetical protein
MQLASMQKQPSSDPISLAGSASPNPRGVIFFFFLACRRRFPLFLFIHHVSHAGISGTDVYRLWSSSPHHLAPLDKRFIVFSIANAYHELPEVLKELMSIKERSYSSAVKKYCDDVHAALSAIHANADIKILCENVKQCSIPMEL